MPRKFQNILQNFKAGQLSPRLSASVDFDAFRNALSDSTNWIISPQGGAQFREGMEYIGIPPSNQPFRIFQFHRGGDVSDILIEVSSGLIRFWVEDPDGTFHLFEDLNTLLVDEDDDFFLTDEDDGFFLAVGISADDAPYDVDELDQIYFTNQANFGILCHPSHPPIYITIFTDGSLLAQQLPIEKIPLFTYNDIKNPGFQAGEGNWRIIFPDGWGTAQYVYYMTYKGVTAKATNSALLTVVFGQDAVVDNAPNIKAGIEAAAFVQGIIVTAIVTPVVGSEATVGGVELAYDINITGDEGGWEPTAVRLFPYYWGSFDPTLLIETLSPVTQNRSGDDLIGGDSIEEDAWSYPGMITIEEPAASGTFVYYQVKRSHTAAAINEPGVGADWDSFWILLGGAVPDGYDYQYPSGNLWVDGTVYFEQDRGFPTVPVFHDQRLILMANKDNPTALYGSAIARYQSFEPGPEDDNPFIFVLDSSDTPAIKWAHSHLDLMIGTSSGDWRISAKVTITPTDIQANQQNKARADLNMVSQVDTEIFYIEQGQRKLRVTRYVRDMTSFSSTDASLLSEELVSASGIKRLTASYVPEVMLTMVRNDGQPIFLTYEKVNQVMAFAPCKTDGFVNDAAAYYSLFNKEDFVYFAIERNGAYVLERMRYPCGKICAPLSTNNIVYLDSWVTGTLTGKVIDGLDHLTGKEVAVLVDDAWQIGTFEVEAGQVVLTGDYIIGSNYAVGLLYEGTMTTFEVPDNLRGTGMGAKRRWVELTTRLLNSALPTVYGQRAEDRTPSTPMGIAETVRDGVQDVNQSTVGYGNGSITVVMDRPYPCQVLAFFGEYQVEDR